jgi:hypothetical protein
VSQSFGYIPKSGIAGSNGRSMSSFFSSLQIFFQSGCTSLHSHQQCKRVPFSPHPHQHLLLVGLLTINPRFNYCVFHCKWPRIFRGMDVTQFPWSFSFFAGLFYCTSALSPPPPQKTVTLVNLLSNKCLCCTSCLPEF